MQNIPESFPMSDNRWQSTRAYFQQQLQGIYPDFELDTLWDLTIEHWGGILHRDLVKQPDYRLNQSVLIRIKGVVERLKNGEPIQYILGKAYFYNRPFKVSSDVLIPRPETEELIHWILTDFPNSPLHVMDIGTGSGCIPITLKLERSAFHVQAVDICKQALEIAKQNSNSWQTDVAFLHGDLQNEPDVTWPVCDILVSNPPYVTHAEKDSLARHVIEQEPHLALFAPDNDALYFYKRLIVWAQVLLKPHGAMYWEIHRDFGVQLVKLLEQNGYESVELRKDLQGNFRMIKAIKNG